MEKELLKELTKLEKQKDKLLTKKQEIQKQIDNVDNKIKEYKSYKKQYDNLEKKVNNCINNKQAEEKTNEWTRCENIRNVFKG